MSENYTKVQQAFRVLHPLLAGYICQEMRREYQDNWWQEVLMTLSDQVRDLPDDNGDYAALMDSLDMANCLRLFDRKWNDLFKRKLSIDYRTWAKELMGVRNKLAHIGGTDFSEDDTWRALDTMARLCEAFDDEAATLRKTAQDRATQVTEADVIEEIESRLKKLRREEPFAGLHVCPASSLDVPDEQAARLVILRTEDTHRANAGASAAITAAENILNNHGSKPRTYRNMLAFVAPDQEAMLSLRQAVRDFRAWRSIQDDKETLNLDAAQNKEVDASLHRCNDTVEARIKETYCWLLTPEIDCFVDMKTIQWDASRISGGTDSIVAKASRKMQQSETLITKWAPALLLMELNNVLWKDTDCIQIKKLWEYLCTYCYLPRLAKYSVLEDAIRTGLNSQEYFALAAGYTGDRYVELRYNQFVDCINTSDLLVKLDPARKQLLAEKSAPAVVVQPTQTAQGGEQPTLFNLPPDAPIDPTVTLHQPPTAQPATVPAPPKNTRFYMTAELDTTRINRDVQRLVEEVITHLLSADGCKVSVTLDVTADAPDGLSTPIVRTVMENCKTLKVKDFGVDE